MFTNVRYGSSSQSKENIDVCSVQENCAWVIDGADALFPTNISDCESDGSWFVRELNLYLKQNLQIAKLPISDVMHHALKRIHTEFLKFPQAEELCDMQMPSACCAILRIHDHKLSYFIMGNCQMVLTFENDKIVTLQDLRLQELDAKLLEISQDARKKQRMPLFRARNFMDTMLVENRLRRNLHGGYYVLSEEAEIVKHGVVGTLDVAHLKSVTLICNGFSQYFNNRKVVQNLDQYLQQKRNQALVESYDYLLQKKHKNPKLATYMQEKLSGQSTLVHFDYEAVNLLK